MFGCVGAICVGGLLAHFYPSTYLHVYMLSSLAFIVGEIVEREYTPIVHFGESSHDSSYLKLMIKIYPKGKMTQHLATTKVGM